MSIPLPLTELSRVVRRLSFDLVKTVSLHRARRARADLVSVICRLPLLNRIRHFALTDVVSLRELAASAPDQVSEWAPVSPPSTIHFTAERQLALLRHGRSFRDGVYSVPPRFHCTIRDAYFNLKNGALCASDGRLIQEGAPESGRSTRYHSAGVYGGPRPDPRTALRLEGIYSSVWGTWAANYGHWLIECLPRTALLEAAARDKSITLIMAENVPAVHKDSLSCCLPEGVPLLYIADAKWAHPERFILLSYGTREGGGYLPKESCDYVRRAVFRRFGLGGHHRKNRRIYISRRNTGTRRVINEDEVEEALSKYGFSAVCPETLPFEQQVRLFHEAEIVVAPEGSGLANILFSSDIQVLEILSATRPRTFFFFLAQAMGQEYYHLFSRASATFGDFRVDVPGLQETVERMLRARPQTCHSASMPAAQKANRIPN
jgi:hypothetical protein